GILERGRWPGARLIAYSVSSRAASLRPSATTNRVCPSRALRGRLELSTISTQDLKKGRNDVTALPAPRLLALSNSARRYMRARYLYLARTPTRIHRITSTRHSFIRNASSSPPGLLWRK